MPEEKSLKEKLEEWGNISKAYDFFKTYGITSAEECAYIDVPEGALDDR